jgi:hypothetical protein
MEHALKIGSAQLIARLDSIVLRGLFHHLNVELVPNKIKRVKQHAKIAQQDSIVTVKA